MHCAQVQTALDLETEKKTVAYCPRTVTRNVTNESLNGDC